MSDAEQLAFDGFVPRKRRRRAPASHTPAAHDPVARVVLDVQAVHLGQTFDYLIDEKDADRALPGRLVRVRFGGRRVDGVIWERAASSDTPSSSLRYLERVVGDDVLVPERMRRDITLVADAYGGTRANILRLAVPPRVAKVEREQRLVDGLASAASAASSASAMSSASARPPFSPAADRAFSRMERMYEREVRDLRDALHGRSFRSFVFDPLPGNGQAADALAWMAVESMAAGRGAVVVLPGMREIRDLMDALVRLGLTPFGPTGVGTGGVGTGGWRGDVAVLSADMPPADRYRAYLAVATGSVRCVIGTRAAMYAPVSGPSLFAVMDDGAYQHADGMMPYAQARGVLRLRAQAHGGVFVALAAARTPLSQMEVSGLPGGVRPEPTAVSGRSTPVRPLPSVLAQTAPWVRWLNREELARLADPSIGARVPHAAVRNIRAALESGPVLFSIPSDGVAESLSCANRRCLRQARCARCTGPLQRVVGTPVPRCRWCNAAASNWTCPHCHGERMRVVRVGAAGTAQELRGLFRDVPVVLSSPSQPGGVVREVEHRPLIVIATPGAEPRVRMPAAPPRDEMREAALREGLSVPPRGDNPDARIESARRMSGERRETEGGVRFDASSPLSETGYGSYAAVAILDAWTSLYAPGLDARVDTLSSWMRVAGLCAPRVQGGQVLLIGETDPLIARSLMLWNSSVLALGELADRCETGMPPAVSVACVWGRRDAVERALRSVGAVDGDLAWCPMAGVAGMSDGVMPAMASDGGAADSLPASMPAVLGPVPIAPPRTVDARELEITADRVRAVVRVPHGMREELAARLRVESARHAASRDPGELRFQLDRKDLI